MRIVYWTELFWPYIGGVEVLSLKLLPELRTRGCEFVVITSHENVPLPAEDSFHGIPVRRFGFRDAIAGRNLNALADIRRRINALLCEFSPDIVHFCGMGTGAFLYGPLRGENPPALLVTLQQQILPIEARSPQSVVSTTLGRADWVTAVSQAALEQARALVPAITPRSSLIYNFVETPTVVPVALPFDPPRLLCIGRIIYQKGFDLAVQAFAALRHRHPAARLIIAGDGTDRPALEQLASTLGVGDAVDFLGWVQPEEVPSLLNRCTVVLMPSRYEGLPLVAVQAAAMARPVIATRVGGNAEVVRHGETGLLIEPEDVHALAGSITHILEHPETARAWGRAGREHALRVFEPMACIARYADVYTRLAAERGQQVAVHE